MTLQVITGQSPRRCKLVWNRRASPFRGRALFSREIKPLFGNGYLAGEFPGGITTVESVPSVATVRAILRTSTGSPLDGVVAGETQSAQDGTWRISGLNPDLRFDVVGRKDGFNDVIMSDVTPSTD